MNKKEKRTWNKVVAYAVAGTATLIAVVTNSDKIKEGFGLITKAFTPNKVEPTSEPDNTDDEADKAMYDANHPEEEEKQEEEKKEEEKKEPEPEPEKEQKKEKDNKEGNGKK